MGAKTSTHTVVIGAGPGGYVCAIRLAQLGVDTLLVEKRDLGGVCLNVGCIPSKALITASKLVHQIREAEEMGIIAGPVTLDLEKMIAWKAGIVGKLTSGVGHLVEGNGGKILRGAATFTGPNTLDVTGSDGETTTVSFENAVIATGSVPTEIPGFELDGEHVVSSTEALAWTKAPERIVVIGGGYIGMEMGGVWQRMGSQVTVVEFADRILPGFAKDLSRPVQRRFKAHGGAVKTKTKATSWKKAKGGGVTVTIEDLKSGKESTLEADVILLTVGRRPMSSGLGLETAGVATDARGIVTVDGAQRTNVGNIYAIGDVAGEPMLAHKGSKEGEVAAEVIAGKASAFDVRGIPAVVFTDPEIAGVGMTEEEAKAAGHKVSVGRFSFAANGRALSLNDADGFVRLVFDSDTEVLLGGQIVGPEASNLIAEVGLALEMGALASDLALTIHAHPTLSETVMEASAAALGHAIHALGKR
ncbi:MAG: dihydrolipoyl dehydrogenase [Myxococcota bacterium]